MKQGFSKGLILSLALGLTVHQYLQATGGNDDERPKEVTFDAETLRKQGQIGLGFLWENAKKYPMHACVVGAGAAAGFVYLAYASAVAAVQLAIGGAIGCVGGTVQQQVEKMSSNLTITVNENMRSMSKGLCHGFLLGLGAGVARSWGKPAILGVVGGYAVSTPSLTGLFANFDIKNENKRAEIAGFIVGGIVGVGLMPVAKRLGS